MDDNKNIAAVNDKKGTAATKAKNKYNAANYDRLYPYVPKGRKEIYQKAAKLANMSLNEFITIAIEEKVQKVMK